MSKTIYLDLHGVLIDFVPEFCERFDLPMPERYADLDEHLDKMKSLSAFWWCTLPRLDWPLYLGLREHVTIVTKPCSVACAVGTLRWCEDHCSDTPVITIAEKWRLAREDTLLIDDCPEHVDSFRLHGGVAITYPQPWNSAEPNTEISVLQRALGWLDV